MENILKLEENTISIFIPMKLKRRGGAAMVIVPEKASSKTKVKDSMSDKPNYDFTMIKALAKAYKWQKQMKKGDLNISQLAAKENISDRYVSRILRLNNLAPDIVEAIIEGKQPRDLKLQDLTGKAIPDLWEEQRMVFGLRCL